MSNLKILGEALINENAWFISNKIPLEKQGYKPYLFLGRDVKIENEDVEKYGKNSFLILEKGDNKLVFVNRYINGNYKLENDISDMIPCDKELNWKDPMFILEKSSIGWSIYPTSEGEKYMD